MNLENKVQDRIWNRVELYNNITHYIYISIYFKVWDKIQYEVWDQVQDQAMIKNKVDNKLKDYEFNK